MSAHDSFEVLVGSQKHAVRILGEGPQPGQIRVQVDDTTILIESQGEEFFAREEQSAQRHRILLAPETLDQAWIDGQSFRVSARSAREIALQRALKGSAVADGDGQLRSPMPGRVVRRVATVGQELKSGEPLIIVEAMKMENELHAPCDGTLQSFAVDEGDTVDAGQLLCTLTPASEST